MRCAEKWRQMKRLGLPKLVVTGVFLQLSPLWWFFDRICSEKCSNVFFLCFVRCCLLFCLILVCEFRTLLYLLVYDNIYCYAGPPCPHTPTHSFQGDERYTLLTKYQQRHPQASIQDGVGSTHKQGHFSAKIRG